MFLYEVNFFLFGFVFTTAVGLLLTSGLLLQAIEVFKGKSG